jgi:hypothetical protein
MAPLRPSPTDGFLPQVLSISGSLFLRLEGRRIRSWGHAVYAGSTGTRPSFGSPPGVSGSRLSLCHSRRNSSGVGSSRAVSHSIRAYCHALLSSPDQRSTGSFETELVFICTRNLATGRSANHEAESPSNAPGSDGDNKSHALKRQDILRLTCSMYGWKRRMCRVIWLHRRKQGQGGDDKDAPPCPCGGNGK